jgi:hypothetical protein
VPDRILLPDSPELSPPIRMFLLSMRFFTKGMLLEILKVGAPNDFNPQHTDELTTYSYSRFIVHVFIAAHSILTVLQ